MSFMKHIVDECPKLSWVVLGSDSEQTHESDGHMQTGGRCVLVF